MNDADALATVQALYAAFGRGDVPAILDLLTDDVQWRFDGDTRAGYTGEVRGKPALAEWFGTVARDDDIQAFEPRQMLAGRGHVTVIGWERTIARATGRGFECTWVHVFELEGSQVSRFFGLLDSEKAALARAA